MVIIRNGQPIPDNNPITVMMQIRLAKQREAAETLRQQQARRAAARKRGYTGPLTRADLIRPEH
jgi:hypothetical protein